MIVEFRRERRSRHNEIVSRSNDTMAMEAAALANRCPRPMAATHRKLTTEQGRDVPQPDIDQVGGAPAD